MKLLRHIAAGLLFGVVAFGGLALAQTINQSVQLSKTHAVPLVFDTMPRYL